MHCLGKLIHVDQRCTWTFCCLGNALLPFHPEKLPWMEKQFLRPAPVVHACADLSPLPLTCCHSSVSSTCCVWMFATGVLCEGQKLAEWQHPARPGVWSVHRCCTGTLSLRRHHLNNWVEINNCFSLFSQEKLNSSIWRFLVPGYLILILHEGT